jgi:hypothetical protein
MKNAEINIYPVAYVCLDDTELLDYITSEFDSLASGDGQVLFSVEEFGVRVNEMEPSETRAALYDILVEIQGKAGEVYFYAR